jgi:hypothetical protein
MVDNDDDVVQALVIIGEPFNLFSSLKAARMSKGHSDE